MSALREIERTPEWPEGERPVFGTIDQFFDWIEHREERYELVDGVPVMMPWVKRSHARIVSNIDFALQSILDRDAFMVTQGGFAIETGPRSIRYADVLVEEASSNNEGRTSDVPRIIVEVLSKTTTPDDFGPKRLEYLGLETLSAYVIVDQHEPCVWVWRRGDEGWPDHADIVRSGTVRLPRFDVDLPLKAIYRNVFDHE